HAVAAGVADGEPRALQLEETGENGRRRKVERLGELLGRQRLLAAKGMVQAGRFGGELRRRLRSGSHEPGARADRRKELGEDVLRAAAQDGAVSQELVRADRGLRKNG